MERRTYEAEDFIYNAGEVVDRMMIIQSGIVQLSIPYDKRVQDEEFIIERLGPGAILNHQAFMIKDIADTDYQCKGPVSTFELTYNRMKSVLKRRADL